MRIIGIVVSGCKHGAPLKIRVQSVETGLFLTRTGGWTARNGAVLYTDAVEAIRLCLRLGIKNVRFTANNGHPGTPVYVYPFGGDPADKAYRKEVYKKVAEQRKMRVAVRLLKAKIRALEEQESRTRRHTRKRETVRTETRWAKELRT